ncbi:hypothetical protein F4824DRAFT_500403 [Ustulina deusta]|nr:hypothetical protein F4824DRAFT_500403 [Ustulina deusta]
MPISAHVRQPSMVMAKRCVGKDGTYLDAVAPLSADRTRAWRTVNKSPLFELWDSISDKAKIKAPLIFQVLTKDHCYKMITVAQSITRAFKRKITRDRNVIENSMEKAYDKTTKPQCRQGGARQSFLSKLPVEIIDIIVEYSLEYRFQIFIWLDKRPKEVRWIGSRPKMELIYNERPWLLTKEEILSNNLSEDAVLNLRDAWPQISSVPLFHVCKLLRGRLLGVAVRKWTELEPWIEGEARISYLSPRAGARGNHWMRIGILPSDSTYHRQPPNPGQLRDIPYLLRDRSYRLHFETVWSWEKKALLTPLRDILGFADDFGHTRSITVTCRVCFLEPDNKLSRKELADTLYDCEGGVFRIIADEIATVFDVAAWDVVTGRSGLWPDYCLLPNCMRYDDKIDACQHIVPELSYRILNVQLRLIPYFGEAPSWI